MTSMNQKSVRLLALAAVTASPAAFAQVASQPASFDRAFNGNGQAAGRDTLEQFLLPLFKSPPGLLHKYPEADLDKDGAVSAGERRAFTQERITAFKADLLNAHPELDRDRDRELSSQELRAGMAAIQELQLAKLLSEYPDADQDRDGKLTIAEARKYQVDKAMAGAQAIDNVAWVIANFQNIDVDRNGQLSLDELRSAQGVSFPERKRQERRPAAHSRGDAEALREQRRQAAMDRLRKADERGAQTRPQ